MECVKGAARAVRLSPPVPTPRGRGTITVNF
jgi:hypothetical protein